MRHDEPEMRNAQRLERPLASANGGRTDRVRHGRARTDGQLAVDDFTHEMRGHVLVRGPAPRELLHDAKVAGVHHRGRARHER